MDGRILLLNRYPLELDEQPFHIGFPVNAEEDHKNRYLEDEDSYYIKSGTINSTRLSDLELDALVQYGYSGDAKAFLQQLVADGILEAIFSETW